MFLNQNEPGENGWGTIHRVNSPVHRSYLVAIGKISFLEGNRLRVNESDIPVGQSFREGLLRRMEERGKKGNRESE